MRGRLTRLVTVVACSTLLVGGVPTAVGASTRSAPGAKFCSAFQEYFGASFAVELAASLARSFEEAGDGGSSGGTAEEVRNTFYLVLSPKLEKVTRQMSTSGPRVLRATLRKQAEIFATGVEQLRGLGVTDEQIDALANATLDTTNADLEEQTGKLDIKKAELTKAAREFGKKSDELDVSAVSDKQRKAYTTAGSQCGTFPSSEVECETLVTPDEANRALGVDTKRDPDDCAYAGPEPATGIAPALAVDVYESALAFENLTKSAQNQNVPNVGEDAVALEGFSSFSSTKTCGKTLIVQDGDRTVVVALCLPDDADVPIETLTALAQQILERLPTA